MSVGYILVNASKQEYIRFLHIGASTANELTTNSASSTLTTWYLLQNLGDKISFVSDTYDDWPFAGNRQDLHGYR